MSRGKYKGDSDKRSSQAVCTALSIARIGEGNPMWRGGSTPEKKAAYGREWRKRNERYVRDREYRKRFGITIEMYEAMVEAQGGVCAICKEECRRGRLAVDHDHETGEVRGLLCRACNVIIGLFKDDREWLKQAEAYLACKKRSTA